MKFVWTPEALAYRNIHMRECRNCQGTGKDENYDSPCPSCHGEGVVEEDEFDDTGPSEEEKMPQRIAEPVTAGKHDDLILWLNDLIVDLKLELLKQRHEIITMERLEEGTRLVGQLGQCRLDKRSSP